MLHISDLTDPSATTLIKTLNMFHDIVHWIATIDDRLGTVAYVNLLTVFAGFHTILFLAASALPSGDRQSTAWLHENSLLRICAHGIVLLVSLPFILLPARRHRAETLASCDRLLSMDLPVMHTDIQTLSQMAEAQRIRVWWLTGGINDTQFRHALVRWRTNLADSLRGFEKSEGSTIVSRHGCKYTRKDLEEMKAEVNLFLSKLENET